MSKLDLVGMKFSRLTVIEKYGKSSQGSMLWICKCECGNLSKVRSDQLKSGKTKSCGCLCLEINKKRLLKHGKSGKNATPEYAAWHHIKDRCTNPKEKRYYDYGGRGIKMCERWLSSFEAFLEDMGERPSPRHSIDRYPNNDGDYEPSNCRWATTEQQSRGKRSNQWIVYKGEKMIIAELSKKLNTDVRKLYTWKRKKSEVEFYESVAKLEQKIKQA